MSPKKAYEITKTALVGSPATNTRGVANRTYVRSPQNHIPTQENPTPPTSPLSPPTSPAANTRGAVKRTEARSHQNHIPIQENPTPPSLPLPATSHVLQRKST